MLKKTGFEKKNPKMEMKNQKRNTTKEENNPKVKREISRSGDQNSDNNN